MPTVRTTLETPKTYDFIEDLENHFSPARLLESLLNEPEEYLGQKDIQLAAFCKWALFPHEPGAVRRAVIIRLAERIDFLEKKYVAANPRLTPSKAYSELRSDNRHAPLFNDMYYRLDGIRSVINSFSIKAHAAEKNDQLRKSHHVYLLLALIHYNLASAGDVAASKVSSQTKALKAYGEIFKDAKHFLKERQLKTYWQEARGSLSFVYAGFAPLDDPHELQVRPFVLQRRGPPTSTVLEQMLLRRRSFKEARQLFIRWVSRARYTQEQIVARIPAIGFVPMPFGFPESVLPEPIPVPVLAKVVADTVAATFRDGRYNKSV